MRARVLLAIVGIVLSVAPRSVRAETTDFVYTYGGYFGLRIPEDAEATKGGMQDAVIAVPDHLIIRDLNVSLSITHTAAFDLRLSLRNPAGKTVTLTEPHPFTEYYAGENYTATTFDDEADTAIEDGLPPFTGSYRPVESLAAFDGRNAYGLWRLQVYDTFYADTGYLDSFTLTLTTSAPVSKGAMLPAPAAGGLVLLGLGLLGPVVRAGRHPSRGPSAPASS